MRPWILSSSPAPSMIVVLSLSTTMRLARPRSVSDGVLELEADFLADDLAAGEDRDVLQHRLAAIAEARRLDGARRVSVPRSLLTTSVASASPSTSSAMMSSGRALLRDLLEHREQILHRRDLLVVDQDERILEDRFHLLRIGDEVRREVAAVELHALDRLERRLEALAPPRP